MRNKLLKLGAFFNAITQFRAVLDDQPLDNPWTVLILVLTSYLKPQTAL